MTVSLSAKRLVATVLPSAGEKVVVIPESTVRNVRFAVGVELDHLDVFNTEVRRLDVSDVNVANIYCQEGVEVITAKDDTQKVLRRKFDKQVDMKHAYEQPGEAISGMEQDSEGEAQGADVMVEGLSNYVDSQKRIDAFFQRITNETEGRLVAPPSGSPRWDVLAHMYESFIADLPEAEQLELAFKILDSNSKPLPESLVNHPSLALEYQVRLERMRPVGVTSGREGEVIYDEDGTYSRINDMIARESGMPASTASINDQHNQPIAVMCGSGNLFRILRDHRGLPVEVLQVDSALNTCRTEYVYDVYGLLQSSTQDGVTRTYHLMWHENILIEFYMEEGIDETSRFVGIKSILRFKI